MNPFLRYLADKNSAHTQTDRHTPLTTIPDGLRRAGNNRYVICLFFFLPVTQLAGDISLGTVLTVNTVSAGSSDLPSWRYLNERSVRRALKAFRAPRKLTRYINL